MTAAIVIAGAFVGLIVREALFQRHLRRLAKQRLQDDFDSERLRSVFLASCKASEHPKDNRGEA